MSKPVQTLAVAALAFVLLAPAAWAGANDHANHQKAQSGASQKMDHGQMNHGAMDHSQMPGMDHSQMQNMDHGKMDHGAMHPAQDAKPKAESKDDR